MAVCLAAGVVALPAAATMPNQWVTRATAAARSAHSVHVVAAGIPSGSSTISFDLHIVSGHGGYGTIGVGKQRIDLIRSGKSAYFRADAAFWRRYGGAAAARLFAGRWVKLPISNKDFASFIELTNISQFFTGILSSHGKLARGGTKTIDGRPAVGIVDKSKSGGTLWIASTGKPFPLELLPPTGPGVVRFEAWNTPMHVPAPKNPIDLSKLKK